MNKLKSDYAAMNEMFMESAPSIEDIIAELLVIENKINGNYKPIINWRGGAVVGGLATAG